MYFSAAAFNFHTQSTRFENLDNWKEVCDFFHKYTMNGYRAFTVTAFNEEGEVGTKKYHTMMDRDMELVKVFNGVTLKGLVAPE